MSLYDRFTNNGNSDDWSLIDNSKPGEAALLSSKVTFSRSNVNANVSMDSFKTFSFWLLDKFTYDIDAKWEQIIDIADILGGFTKATSWATQRTIGTAGISTRQTYTGSGFLRLTLKGRIVHPRMVKPGFESGGEGFNDLFSQVEYLNKLVLPKFAGDSANYVKDLQSNGGQVGTEALAVGNQSHDGSGIFSADSYIFRNPPIFHVKIGNVFDNDAMVCKRLNVSFSKEYCEASFVSRSGGNQPIYADFEMELSSLYALSSQGENDKGNTVDAFVFFVGDTLASLATNAFGNNDINNARTPDGPPPTNESKTPLAYKQTLTPAPAFSPSPLDVAF